MKERAPLPEEIRFEVRPEKSVDVSIDGSSEECPDQSLVKPIALNNKGRLFVIRFFKQILYIL